MINIQKINKKSITGTRDFPPVLMEKREWLFHKWDIVCRQYGFEKYDVPVIETTNLWRKKVDTNTNIADTNITNITATTNNNSRTLLDYDSIQDDICNEMYLLKTRDDNGNEICLRPEVTPQLVRLVMQNACPILPLKYYSIAQCWRFETLTRGRKREHYQLNCDIIDGSNIDSDTELLALIVRFFRAVNLQSSDIVLKISHRLILQKYLEHLGIGNNFEKICNIIDKKNKLSTDEFKTTISKIPGFDEHITSSVLEFITITDIESLLKYKIIIPEISELEKIFIYAEMYNIRDWIQLDMTIVRGLSYYTGFVFEGFSKSVKINRSICGGGRYDNLMEKFSNNKKLGFVGFGMGDIVITEILDELKLIPNFEYVSQCLIACDTNNVDNTQKMNIIKNSIKIAEEMRSNQKININYCCKKNNNLRNIYDYANKIKVRFVVLVKNDCVSIKDMYGKDDTTKQHIYPIDEYLSNIRLPL